MTVAELAAARLAPNTRKAYEGVLRRFERSGLAVDDLGDDSLAAWLTSRHTTEEVSPATIRLDLAAIRFAARQAGVPDPAGPMSHAVVAGIGRAGRARGRGPSASIGWEAAEEIARAAEVDRDPAGLRDAALISLASDALLRPGELARLRCGHLQADEDGSGRLLVEQSKTDPHALGAVLYVGPRALQRVNAWLSVRGGPGRDPSLFVRLWPRKDQGPRFGAAPLSDESIRRIIRRRALAAGVDKGVGGHSLRIGAAESLASAGASVVEMQLAGRWKSPGMPARYARQQLAADSPVARLRDGRGRQRRGSS